MSMQSQSEWNEQFQRWLRKQWSEEEGRFYRTHHDPNQGGWVFFDWLPKAPRIDSGNYADRYQSLEYTTNSRYQAAAVTSTSAGAQLAYSSPGRKGASIVGTYNTSNPQLKETLDPAFEVRYSAFFSEGTVFAVLFTEPAGDTTKAYNSSISTVLYDQYVHTQIRRFIVVRTKRGFSFACPIFTYGKQATTKPGINSQEHAIAYSQGRRPRLLEGEDRLTKEPICVAMTPTEYDFPLSDLSRICFGIHHPIQHNVKVKLIGKVIDKDIPNLLGYWKMENAEFANNPADAADAWATSPTIEPDSYLYDAVKNPYGYDAVSNQHMYHPKHNPSGYHPTSNVQGFHPQSNPHMYHPTHNFHGYHKEENPAGHHPDLNAYGYHPTHNPYGFHAELAPSCFHPRSNPQGYHAHYNPQGYHPKSNK